MKNEKLMIEIEIPEGITPTLKDDVLFMKKEDKELQRKLNPIINLEIKENKIVVSAKRTTKEDRKNFGTMKAHINNMIRGLTEGFLYKLQAVFAHFPITIIHEKDLNEIVVKNFLGEKKDRRIKIIENVDVKVNKHDIEISSWDIEKAGQVAANLEKGTHVRNKDRRIFQDGIFIIEKPGRVFL